MDQGALLLMSNRYAELRLRLQQNHAHLSEEGVNIKQTYRIGSRIDGKTRSVYSQVHIASHRTTKNRVCVKTYYLGDAYIAADGTSVLFEKRPGLNFSNILSEISALSILYHPGINRLMSVYFDRKYIHLVQELCSGGELYDVLLKKKSINENDALEYFFQMVDAVAYMHSQGIVHRGLSIENVMFHDKERTKVKIISFGSAAEGTVFTQKYGNPLYMAPEVFTGQYDSRCDVWSLGVILYTMVCGFQPFQHKDIGELQKLIHKGHIPNTNNWKKLHENTTKLIKDMLKKDQRPSSNEILNNTWLQQHRPQIRSLFQTFLTKSEITAIDTMIFKKEQLINLLKLEIYRYLNSENILQPASNNLEGLFKSLDEEGNGQLTDEILAHALEVYFGLAEGAMERASNLINRIDVHHRGYITVDEFMSSIRQDYLEPDMISHAFKHLDLDHTGVLSPEILASLTNSENDLEVWQGMVNEFDKHSKNGVTAEELLELVMKYND